MNSPSDLRRTTGATFSEDRNRERELGYNPRLSVVEETILELLREPLVPFRAGLVGVRAPRNEEDDIFEILPLIEGCERTRREGRETVRESE